jgi:hypothetical protein
MLSAGPHAAAAFLVAAALGVLQAGLVPEAQLGGVRATLVAARDEGRVAGGQLLQALDDVGALHAGRVGLGADEDEVVVHDRVALDAEAVGDELVLGLLVVHEHHVGIAAAAGVQRLAGAQRHHLDVDAAGLLELGQQVGEQAGLLGRGGGRHHDGLGLSQP